MAFHRTAAELVAHVGPHAVGPQRPTAFGTPPPSISSFIFFIEEGYSTEKKEKVVADVWRTKLFNVLPR